MPDFYYTILAPQPEPPKETAQAKLISYKGVSMYAAPFDEENYQVLQLCSTNPKDFLRQDLMPGALIPLIQKMK